MSLNKTIQNIQKQNDSIYSSLLAKNIEFNRILIPDGILEEEHIKLLNEENIQLKEIVKANKPVSLPKEIKKEPAIVKKEEKPKLKDNEENLDEDETFEEPVKKFDTITNMEELKRAFFSNEYNIFEELVKASPFKFYKVDYKYNSDKDGAPDFAAKNLLKGFVRNFDDYRKYFMICFRCWKQQDKMEYKYNSLWIVNTNEPIQNIIGSTWSDFEFEEIIDLDQFLTEIKKLPETEEPEFINGYNCIGEAYVH
jgi:hypothetical protein